VALENLVLPQQLAILKRERPHVRLRRRERLFWRCLSSVLFVPVVLAYDLWRVVAFQVGACVFMQGFTDFSRRLFVWLW